MRRMQLDLLRSGEPETIQLPGIRVDGRGSRKFTPVRVTLRLTEEGRAAAFDDSSWAVLAARIGQDLRGEVDRIMRWALICEIRPPYELDCEELIPIFSNTVSVLLLQIGVGGPERHIGPGAATPPWLENDGTISGPAGATEDVGKSRACPPPKPPPPATDGELTAAPAEDSDQAEELARALQCSVGRKAKGIIKDNIVRTGINQVDVLIGRSRDNWVSLLSIEEDKVTYSGGDVADLVVMLTPTRPAVGTPTCHALRLPRHGDSEVVSLDWVVPADASMATAQIILLQGARIIALAEISGDVGGGVSLTSRQTFGSSESWHSSSPIQHAIVHDTADDGSSILIEPGSTELKLFDDLTQMGNELCVALGAAPALKDAKPETLAKEARRILIETARVGARLRKALTPLIGKWVGASHLQVVTGGAPIQLPLELLYDLPTPRDEAVLCPTWLEGGECGAGCGGDDPGAIVCPAAFWGLNRVIERHYWAKGRGEAWLCEPVPDPEHPTLTLDGTLFAASVKVTADMLAKTALDEFPRSPTWDDWRKRLADTPGLGLLILLPHNEDHALEISETWLEEGDVDNPYVIGTDPDRHPLVVLLGCETAGSPSDLYGCGSYFLGAHAAVVLGTLASVDATAAAWLASLVVRVLREPHAAGRSIGEIMTELRRAALRENMVSALALTAYGDSRWGA